MNPYDPPSVEDDELQLDAAMAEFSCDKRAQIVGAIIFATAFAIVGDLVLQPHLDAYFGLPSPQAIAAAVSLYIGWNVGYQTCGCLY